MLMYYDARPSAWNGLFDLGQIGKVTTKGYFPFVMFNTLYRLENCVHTEYDHPYTYACAAKKEDEAAVVFTHFNDDDTTVPQEISLDLSDFGGNNGTQLEVYILDDCHDLELTETLTYFGNRIMWKANVPNFTSYLLKLKKL